MADKPILFGAPMVLALLAGRKTQTRRVLKPQPDAVFAQAFRESEWQAPGEYILIGGKVEAGVQRFVRDADSKLRGYSMPINVGDRLWVRETWMPGYHHDPDAIDGIPKVSIIYDADKADAMCVAPSYELAETWLDNFSEDGPDGTAKRPSIFMPRWASRLTLLVTEVRVLRLQEISEADAIAEGMRLEPAELRANEDLEKRDLLPHIVAVGGGKKYSLTCRTKFTGLWCDLHGYDAWGDNPWVAAYTFTVHATNIDKMPAATAETQR